ncbi:hypothetical protein QBC38DRAFT_545843 [Podospora fimiseda]|uniref:CCHC-type domain-containing protein n=1 Tax=Podospora fimiseda TaxID=252190 RepID=A0AAN7BNG3_9PEZI|nr:hypothetical protein QBC38DRAFT_545843 [Podospora fimiseda]
MATLNKSNQDRSILYASFKTFLDTFRSVFLFKGYLLGPAWLLEDGMQAILCRGHYRGNVAPTCCLLHEAVYLGAMERINQKMTVPAGFPLKFNFGRDKDAEMTWIQLGRTVRKEFNRYRRASLKAPSSPVCANPKCNQSGHTITVCPGPCNSKDGTAMYGCFFCNTVQHSVDDCPKIATASIKTLITHLITNRQGLPPWQTRINWVSLALANYDLVDFSSLPFTKMFVRLWYNRHIPYKPNPPWFPAGPCPFQDPLLVGANHRRLHSFALLKQEQAPDTSSPFAPSPLLKNHHLFKHTSVTKKPLLPRKSHHLVLTRFISTRRPGTHRNSIINEPALTSRRTIIPTIPVASPRPLTARQVIAQNYKNPKTKTGGVGQTHKPILLKLATAPLGSAPTLHRPVMEDNKNLNSLGFRNIIELALYGQDSTGRRVKDLSKSVRRDLDGYLSAMSDSVFEDLPEVGGPSGGSKKRWMWELDTN